MTEERKRKQREALYRWRERNREKFNEYERVRQKRIRWAKQEAMEKKAT